jgi:hypothetical protein
VIKMAKKEATPTQKRSAIVQAAIEKLYADAKKALATTWTETDPLKIAEAAQATEVSPETVKALTRQFWVAKIEELQAEVAVMQADLSEASRQWREALDEAVKKREAAGRVLSGLRPGRSEVAGSPGRS